MFDLLLLAGALGGVVPVPTRSSHPHRAKVRETIVVTAAAEPTPRRELPATVTIIRKDEIAARHANAISSLVASVAGATLVRAGGPGQQTSLFLRGAGSNQTLVLWNGVPLNDPYFGDANLAFLSTDGVKRVEVARGPLSVLYGSSAMGGVVQVLTGRQQGATIDLEGGEHAYRRGSVAAGIGTSGLHVDLVGHLRDGSGWFANSGYHGREGLAHLDWRARDGLNIGLLAQMGRDETGIPFSNGLPSPERRLASSEERIALPLSMVNGDWHLEGLLSRVTMDRHFRDPLDPFGFTASHTRSQALRGRAVASYGRDRHWSLSVGSEIERLEVSDSSVFGTNLDGAHQRTLAGFAELHGSWDHVAVAAGLRRDQNDVYGGKTSPRLGVVVDLGGYLRLHASYGEGFRAPSLGELFYPGSGNPALKPETSRSFELGLSREASWQAARVRLALTAFDNHQRQLIDFDFATFKDVNIGRAASRGLEGEVTISEGVWRLRANATRLDAKDQETGLALLRRPRWSANLVLTAASRPWRLSVVGRYVGARPDVDPLTFARTTNPAYLCWDLSLGRSFGHGFEPYLEVRNLSGERYAEALGFPAPGRTILGGLEARLW